MMHLGHYNTATTRTHVRFQFSTHAAAGANVAPSSAFEAADLRIYKAAGGAAFSATQRSSAAGITMTSPFDSLVGVHDVDIDLTDNTDASFYAAGSFYSVVLSPDETIDSQTITGVVLAVFEIGPEDANVAQWLGTAPPTPTVAGVPEVDLTHAGGTPITGDTPDVNVVSVDGFTTIDGKTISQLLALILTAAAGNITGAEAANPVVLTAVDGSVTRISSVVDEHGNRTNTLTVTSL